MKKITLSFLAAFLFSVLTVCSQTVLINFSQDTYAMTGNWNNVVKGTTIATTTDSLSSIVDNTGAPTSIKLKVRDVFDGYNGSGYVATSGDAATLGFTGNASKYNLYIMNANGKAIIRLWGLDINKVYSFSFYGGHMYPNGEVRSGRLTATGQNTAKDSLDVALNTSTVKTISNIIPTPEGYIDLTFVAAANNTNVSKYAYLAALQIIGSTPVATNIKNAGASIISARLEGRNLLIGDYTGLVNVYTINGTLMAKGQAVFGYMPLNIQKGIYLIETTQGKCKLSVH